MFDAIHDRNGKRDVVVVVLTCDTEPWDIACFHRGDVFDIDGDAIDLGQDHVLDVGDSVALGQILIAAVIDETDTAYVDRLLAEGDLAAAHIRPLA
jgi:hypothetical protein